MRALAATAALAVALTGCTSHHDHPVAVKAPDDTAVKSAPATISPYRLMRDPTSQNRLSDVPLAGGPGKGRVEFPLRMLPPEATHLITRWVCNGKGVLKVIIDGVMWAESPCANNMIASGDLPLLKITDRHPKLLVIDAPADTYWKVTIVEQGGAIS